MAGRRTEPSEDDLSGNFNRFIGWALLAFAFAGGSYGDGGAFSGANLSSWSQFVNINWRQTQAVWLAMGILQLMFACYVSREVQSFRSLAWTIGAGAILYCLGHIYIGGITHGARFAGSMLLILVFPVVWSQFPQTRVKSAESWIALIISAGMTLHCFLAFTEEYSSLSFAVNLGRIDGLQLRMLRLAQMAAIALPVIAYLFEDPAEEAKEYPRVVKWGRLGMLAGAAGMPLLLCLAAFTWVEIKYALTLPVGAIVLGTWCGVYLAWKQGRTPEKWFWLMIALSMGVGQFMGTYAFDGPLPAPTFLGGYNDFARRLLRLGHMYAIILGIAGIFASREARAGKNAARGVAWQAWILGAGAVVTLSGIGPVATGALPASALSVGPAIVALAMVAVLVRSIRQPEITS